LRAAVLRDLDDLLLLANDDLLQERAVLRAELLPLLRA
jgi:hypothetical protein